jgi:FkbM family methyltransferase
MVGPDRGYGVGYQILNTAAFDPGEVKIALELLALRRKHHGDGVIAIDCGANIGVHTIEWASAMTGWGSVIAIEAQERIYYALAGNIAINNCFNALAVHAAVSSEQGTLQIPNPDYFTPSSFGSLELRPRPCNEFIGQQIDYTNNTVLVRKMTLDELNLPRVDFIKIDIEGMEMEALAGAQQTIRSYRPILLIEKMCALGISTRRKLPASTQLSRSESLAGWAKRQRAHRHEHTVDGGQTAPPTSLRSQ